MYILHTSLVYGDKVAENIITYLLGLADMKIFWT